jgi:hypothetical protein
MTISTLGYMTEVFTHLSENEDVFITEVLLKVWLYMYLVKELCSTEKYSIEECIV